MAGVLLRALGRRCRCHRLFAASSPSRRPLHADLDACQAARHDHWQARRGRVRGDAAVRSLRRRRQRERPDQRSRDLRRGGGDHRWRRHEHDHRREPKDTRTAPPAADHDQRHTEPDNGHQPLHFDNRPLHMGDERCARQWPERHSRCRAPSIASAGRSRGMAKEAGREGSSLLATVTATTTARILSQGRLGRLGLILMRRHGPRAVVFCRLLAAGDLGAAGVTLFIWLG